MLKNKTSTTWAAFRNTLGFSEGKFKFSEVKLSQAEFLRFNGLSFDGEDSEGKEVSVKLSVEGVVVACNYCKKPVLDTALAIHIDNCDKVTDVNIRKKANAVVKAITQKQLNRKKSEIRSKNAASGAASVLPSSLATSPPRPDTTGRSKDDGETGDANPAPKVKKRKKEAADEKDKDKEKTEKVPKAQKTDGGRKVKGPIDFDRQCGVLLETGLYCTRSITCKIHSMSSKRSVVRSASYDALLQIYQSKNPARPQKAKAAGNLNDSRFLRASALGSRSALGSSAQIQLDSIPEEEETRIIFEAIRCNRPQPIVLHSTQVIPTDTPGALSTTASAVGGSLKLWASYRTRMKIGEALRLLVPAVPR
ncbi:SCA7, zinc-binding domain-containing protein [Cladochytrium replicatum]|nr:SCA7, zinc-binding domain-containing protein [Cladochytrium replicatum]